MSTSLAEQLNRLKTPQTSQLLDSNKRSSILFEQREAAEKDRETIYDIGYSGLQELIALNASFVQFEATLFDKNTIELQRAIESKNVNKHLNVTIKRFMVHLSPYFLLQPAHKCLEWLIRRFEVNLYNRDELMLLIFPYHETRMFVKCVQLLRLNDPNDKWHWLMKIQKPGVPLSKQALLNRAASDNYFLQFIVESTIFAVDELEPKPNTLQVVYAFFCTTLIGALEVADISESHVSNVYAAIRKGLKSTSVDFCAASLMIIGQLVSKAKLSSAFLEKIVEKVTKIPHQTLQTDSLILLVLIYKSQVEMISAIPSEIARHLSLGKWVAAALANIYEDGINILPFFLPLFSECLKNVQVRGESWKESRRFTDKLLNNCFFKPADAEAVIRCALDSYILSEKMEESIIMIESDNEDAENAPTSVGNADVNSWYTNLLKKLELQYSNVFDRIVKEIMRSDENAISVAKKNSLKTVLGFLFTVVCTEDNVNIFEKLYHHNAQHRIEAVKYLVKNMEKMCFSDDSKDLLKDSIVERLSDDSPIVVNEALKFDTPNLIKIVGRENLQKKLIAILESTQKQPSIWEAPGFAALKHLTMGSICNQQTAPSILIATLPFLLQTTCLDFKFVHVILNSALAKHIPFVKHCQRAIGKEEDRFNGFEKILVLFEEKKGLPLAHIILHIINSTSEKDLSVSKAFYSMLLLAYAIRMDCPPSLSLSILDVIVRYDSTIKETHVCDNSKWMVNVSMGTYPINLNISCIMNIIDSTDFSELKIDQGQFNFAQPTVPLELLHKIFEILLAGVAKFGNKKPKLELYKNGLGYLVEKLLPSTNSKIEFFSNYFIVDALDGGATSTSIRIENRLQVHAIKYFNSLIEKEAGSQTATLSLPAFIRILTSLRSPSLEVRTAAFQTLQVISSLKSAYQPLILKLTNRKEEILMDENQLAMILFMIFQESKNIKNIAAIFKQLITYIATTKDDVALVALLLGNLTHVNNGTILAEISVVGLNILNAANGEISRGASTVVLDSYRSVIMQNILSRYNQQTIKGLIKDPTSWQTLLKSTESYNILLTMNAKTLPVAAVALQLFDDDIFEDLKLDHKKAILKAAILSATYNEQSDSTSMISKFFKRLTINSNICVGILNEMAAAKIDVGAFTEKRRGKSESAHGQFAPPPEILKKPEWKCGTTWLEYFQNKRKLTNTEVIVPPLFAVLQKCLEFEEQSSVEYVKQLVLSSILHACVTRVPTKSNKKNPLPDSVFKVELIVKCIRGSQNPQTHHHALQLLCYTAKILPDQVLHNMMDIFTFMGSSVVRHDDAYSFQIITDIISAIIPTLIKANEKKSREQMNALVVPVLKVFSDIILDVPEHRRLPLYVKLIDTLNAEEYLWMFLAVLIESHIAHSEKEKLQNKDKEEFPKRIAIALALTQEFDCANIVITSNKLVEFLKKLQTHKRTGSTNDKIDSEVALLFNINAYGDRSFRHYNYMLMNFVSNMTSSSQFVSKVAALTEEENQKMKPLYQGIIITILMIIPEMSKITEQSPNNDKLMKYWKTMLNNGYDILDNIILLLSPNTLLSVIKGLLAHKVIGVRRKVIELLIKKLQHNPEFFTELIEKDLIALLVPLTDIVDSIRSYDEDSQVTPENMAVQQLTLICVKIMSKHLAQKYPAEFKTIVEILIDVVRYSEYTPSIILAAVILSLAEICSNLRAQSIIYLSSFMPSLIKILQTQLDTAAHDRSDSVLCSLVTGVLRIVETLPLFLSPYLVNMLVHLSQIWICVQSDANHVITMNRLTAIWKKLASTLPLRVMLPTVDQTYKQLVEQEQFNGIGPLMELLSMCFESIHTSSEVAQHMPDLTAFFIVALQFRNDHADSMDSRVVNSLETQMIKAFVALILKLAEGSFRPLFKKIYDWAFNAESDSDSDHRIITFFRFSSEIAKALKSLFILFSSDFIDDSSKFLAKLNTIRDDKLLTVGTDKSTILIKSIIETLYQIFLYDTQGFMNLHRFQTLLQPLVDQIENEIVLQNDDIKEQLALCLAQLGLAVNDDTLWKQLNHEILIKTQNNNSNIRLFALKICVDLASKLGEDYLPLLPETVPFLSELLEDENADVERQCQKSVQELEKILDEPLQKYF